MFTKFEEGDVVVIPYQIKKKSLNTVCVIRKIDSISEQNWVYLVGLLKDGTPSMSRENSAYYRLSVLDKLLPHAKYPKIFGCPHCIGNNQEWWQAPLRSLNNIQFECRQCNKFWEYQNGKFIQKT